MENQYLTYLEEDERLYAVVCDMLPKFKTLNSAQIEKLIFYLKSLHSYYPESDYGEFLDKLNELRNSQDQASTGRKIIFSVIKCVVLSAAAGALFVIAWVPLLASQFWIGMGIICAGIILILFALIKPMDKAIKMFVETDRKYFLSSIRAAKSCAELDWAGLFYAPDWTTRRMSDAAQKQFKKELGEFTSHLRAALYNDEYFEYSSTGLNTTDE